jgi:hypothetical protein
MVGANRLCRFVAVALQLHGDNANGSLLGGHSFWYHATVVVRSVGLIDDFSLGDSTSASPLGILRYT